MTEARTRERERTADQWFGAPREGQVPVRAPAGGGAAATGGDETSAGSRWLRRIGRVLRDAVVAVAILAMVPIGLVSVSNGSVWQSSASSNTRVRLLLGERSRPFALAKDATITPMEAGLLLAALNPASSQTAPAAFPERPVGERAVRPWNDVKLPAAMFATARAGSSWSLPASQSILEAAAKGLSARELAYLKTIATAPLWTQYDLIARAPAVDILGGRFVLPYPDDALAYEMPIMRFAATKELAYAGVSRAAYYLAVGQRAEAEAAIRSIIGFGFAIIDNGTFVIDGLLGQVIVGIGRDALERFYTLTGDPRAAAVVAARVPVGNGPVLPRSNQPKVDFMRERLFKSAENTVEPRTVRYNALQALAISSCTNARELVLGTGPDVKQAFERAGRELARYPSERAILDLTLQTTERAGTAGTNANIPTGGVVTRLLIGASTVAGTVLDNPRMPFCARVITGRLP